MFVMTRIPPALHSDTVRSMDQRTSKPSAPASDTPMTATIDDQAGRPQFLLDRREPVVELA